jgi:hypothetical protein
MMQRNPAGGLSRDSAHNHLEENLPGDLSLQMKHSSQVQHHSRRVLLRWAGEEAFRVPIRGDTRIRRRWAVGPAGQVWDRGGRFAIGWSLPLAIMALLAGCSSPAVRQQRLVAKPNMLFSDVAVFTYHSPKLLPQLAPGFAGSGGAQNSGCTSCR